MSSQVFWTDRRLSSSFCLEVCINDEGSGRLTNSAAIFSSLLACHSVIAVNATESTFPWRPFDRGDENTFILSRLVYFPGRSLPIKCVLLSSESYLGNVSERKPDEEAFPCIFLLPSNFWTLPCGQGCFLFVFWYNSLVTCFFSRNSNWVR